MNRSARTDWELLLAARRHPEAFGDLYDRYAEPVFRWARRAGLPEADAYDLVGEVFARAWVARSRFRDPGDGSAGPWLFGIARNLVASYRRSGSIEARARARLHIERIEEPDASDAISERLDATGVWPEVELALSAHRARGRGDAGERHSSRLDDELLHDGPGLGTRDLQGCPRGGRGERDQGRRDRRSRHLRRPADDGGFCLYYAPDIRSGPPSVVRCVDGGPANVVPVTLEMGGDGGFVVGRVLAEGAASVDVTLPGRERPITTPVRDHGFFVVKLPDASMQAVPHDGLQASLAYLSATARDAHGEEIAMSNWASTVSAIDDGSGRLVEIHAPTDSPTDSPTNTSTYSP